MSKKKSARFWETRPCVADLSLEKRNARFPKEIAFLTKNFPFRSALDVGCGTGFDAINYAGLGVPVVVGLDATRRSLRLGKAREDVSLSQSHTIDWVQADAERLPFRDKSFDFVSAMGSLHHTPDTSEAVREMERVAQKEVVLMLYNRWYVLFWRLKNKGAQPNYDNGAPIVKFYTARQVRRLFSSLKIRELRSFGPTPTNFSFRRLRIRITDSAGPNFLKWAWYVRATREESIQ